MKRPKKSGLPQYLEAMRRVDRALRDLNTTNLRSNQKAITDFNSLLAVGNKKLQDTLHHVLSEYSETVEPLHFIAKGKIRSSIISSHCILLTFVLVVGTNFPTIPDNIIAELEQICGVINSTVSRASQRAEGESPSLLIYAEHRGALVSQSLHNLAIASVNTVKRKPSEGLYRPGSNAIGPYSQALEGFIYAEYETLRKIFKGGQQGLALQTTFRSALAEYAKTLRELNDYIRANLMTDCFLAFEIIQIVSTVSFKVEERTGELKSLFLEAIRPVRETAKVSVSELIEDTKRKATNIPAFPLDGSPVSMVSEVMDSLARLMGYSEPLASVLTALGDGNWRTRSKSSGNGPLDVSPDSTTLLCHYALDVVETLMMMLEGRSRAFLRSKAILGVFLTNVFCIVDRHIRHSPALSRYLGTQDSIARIDAFRKRATATYLEAWRETSHFLLDVQYTSRNSSGSARPTSRGPVDSAVIVKSLPSREKDSIKDKFKSFNATFDELVVRHKSLYMEREVRGVLGREVQAIIEPLYARFYDRYHEIDKGRGKYVKYDKAALSAQLAALA